MAIIALRFAIEIDDVHGQVLLYREVRRALTGK